MILFKLAVKNVKRNFYNYFLYFISMIFSIMIYYTFISIEYNNEVLNLMGKSKLLAITFKAASVVIAIFVTVFIWYSNSFFIKKRKKEIALYSIMGVKKRQIGRMLFYENIVIAILALVSGIIMGGILSKLFVMLLVKLMGFSIAVKFVILKKAIKDTVITFAILFFITAIHGYTIIYRFKLIELFKAEKKGESRPKAPFGAAIISIALILGGYLIYITGINDFFILNIIVTLGSVIVGTYLFFGYFLVFVIKISRKNKRKYYKGINMIATSQMLYRIKSNSRTLATIAILSATTLTATGITSSIYYDFQTKQDIRNPFSYVMISNNKSVYQKIENIMKKHDENKIINSLSFNFVRVKAKLPSLGEYRKNYEEPIYLISKSDFTKVAKMRGLKEDTRIKNSKEVMVFDQYYLSSLMESYEGKNVKIILGENKNEFYKIVNFSENPLISIGLVTQIVVVQDEVYNKYANNENKVFTKVYNNKNNKKSKKLTEELQNTVDNIEKNMSKEELEKNKLVFISYYSKYKSELMTSGLLIFIGSFLGLVFLLATGSIIFFRQLSEANDARLMYKTLKKIGVNKKEIKSSINKQILLVFISPLIIGTMHSFVAISILGRVLNMHLIVPVGISTIIYTVIYMMYYLFTVNSYNKLINVK